MDILGLFRDSKNAVRFSAGETLFEEGATGDAMFVITEGKISVQLDGNEVDTVEPGGILGEMALVDGSPRSASAVAVVDSEVVPIDREWFNIIVQREPNFALHVMSVTVQRLRRLMRLIG